MNNFWHFGDSFAFNNFDKEHEAHINRTWPTVYQTGNFGDIISSDLNMKYRFHAKTGDSNELIFREILTKNNDFKSGDFILVNWSFFSRSTFVDFRKDSFGIINCFTKPTNQWFDEGQLRYTKDYHEIKKYKEQYTFLMEYILNYNFDITFKLFKDMVQPYFETLLDKGVNIFNVFIEYPKTLKYGSEKVRWQVPKADMGKFINFQPDYYTWLSDNNFLREEEGHYVKGIQPILAKEIKKRMKIFKKDVI